MTLTSRPGSLAELAAAAAADPASVTPAELAAVVAVTPPHELRAAASGELRDLTIDIVLGRLPEFVTPERWQGDPLRLALRLTGRRGGGSDTVVLTLDGATAAAVRGDAGTHAPADVSIEADAVDLLLLVTGQEHAALLFLRGGLRLDGDVRLAIAAAACFSVPGVADGAEAGPGGDLDPLAIDANAVSRVVKDLSDKDLRARMAGGVRDIVLGEIFARFADHLRRERTAEVEAAVAWRISGREDGGVDEFTTLIDRGSVRLVEAHEHRPRVSIQVEAADFLKLVTGNANPAMMFMRRKISVRGDLGFAAQLTGMFRIPG
ncbi:SCP2 sterol-binding domain-containing protein [Paraconexibacter antarcticus]|uniref:SCP2 sterol-binding domain-containing protein n=1 Tax=Paraconexibacter antarcticus TaxID=2949664 RepID=A0ABY5DWH7_9ACTN|nr:SCP2 sterol-binding domain-containing protein [Paraconexibacter antarcticus]UTI65461.1 SCP2 sterol-binding domain-containing protein [Paraconexibacter antarcticus]